MLYKTHMLGGFAAGYLATGSPACGAVSAVFSLLPDIESPKSFIGRRLLPVSAAGKLVFGHRQAFHSLLAALVFSGAAYLILGAYIKSAGLSCFAGYVSHLILDSFNPAGVPWLWPYKTRVKIPLVQTGSIIERAVVLPALTVFNLILFGRSALLTVISFLKGVSLP